MQSILHTELIKQLSPYMGLLKTPSSDKPPLQWKSRTVSETNKIRLELQQLLKTEQKKEYTNSELLDRICTMCNVDEKHTRFLQSFSKSSPKRVAAALAEAILNTATMEQKSDVVFYQELQDWIDQGEKDEERIGASEEIIEAYKENATMLDLSSWGLKSIPNALKYLTHLKELDISDNKLTELPDIFASLNQLHTISLDDNKIIHFPKTLFCINRPLSVSILNTQISNTIITPSIEKKINEHGWQVSSGDGYDIFSFTKNNFLSKIKHAKANNLFVEDYVNTQRIANDDDGLEKQVQDVLLNPYHQHDKRIKNQTDFHKKSSICNFDNFRLLSCGDENNPINIFGCARLTRERPITNPKKMDRYLQDLSFIYSEVDTLIPLVDRSSDNKSLPIVNDSAGTKTHHPTNVLSMPITDFCPPRFNHFLTLANEMSPTLSSKKPKGILLFCNSGKGRTGTMMTAAKMLDEFKKLDSKSKKDLTNISLEYMPETFNGDFYNLSKTLKTTSFVGGIVQYLRKLEHDTTSSQEGLSVETDGQFKSLELFQCLLGLSEKLKETPAISDTKILETINKAGFTPETIENFFQIDYTQSAQDIILDSLNKLHITLSKT